MVKVSLGETNVVHNEKEAISPFEVAVIGLDFKITLKLHMERFAVEVGKLYFKEK